MTKLNQIYRCAICGNMVEVTHAAQGTLSCCGQPMEPVPEIADVLPHPHDSRYEKHVPSIQALDGACKITVGAEEHPMLPEHHIEWIEVIEEDENENRILRKYLRPGEKPSAIFKTSAKKVTVREYCNVHGLWVARNE